MMYAYDVRVCYAADAVGGRIVGKDPGQQVEGASARRRRALRPDGAHRLQARQASTGMAFELL